MRKIIFLIFTIFFLSNAFSETKELSCPTFKSGALCLSEKPFCGDTCSNTPFCRTNCWPTEHGSAWSGGGVDSQTKQLYCEEATYANCHFSGPSYPTGSNSDNPILPCKVSDDGKTADCRCKVFKGHNYVNIDGIMNLGVYYETVKVCGEDGSKCKNLSTCLPDDSGKCEGVEAPVCKYIAAQNSQNDDVSFIPGADLISTYGFGMNEAYAVAGPKGGTQCNNIDVAGCMAQPCKYEEGSDNKYAICSCPITKGASLNLHQKGASCDIPKGYVWE
ncbi:hypothetical protein [Francisella frigiditurris]|uniref:Uncharacterized protein n=1 Tax=Francisella frigiditurris TaxID=1542390 RepID=A0A1J0KUF2_9GAMM|nr:hypothetical protein [Francisella frigiditurris]APC97278.1 hypothetical protein KX01_457 [Francisella frigiditurris]